MLMIVDRLKTPVFPVGRFVTSDLDKAGEEYKSLVEHALGDWMDCGVHAQDGFFAERRDFRGSIVAGVPRRAMVQARQIFVYCDWVMRGGPAAAGEAALNALAKTIEVFAANDLRNGAAFSIEVDGKVGSDKRDAYTQSFLLFALAAAYKLTGEKRYLKHAEHLDHFICTWLMDNDHGGLYSSPLARGEKAQNPLMHLLEAYLFLHDAHPNGVYLEKAQAITELFVRRMLRSDPCVLPEHFAHDWSEHPDAASGSFFEPGHHFEWIWLLTKFDGLSGEDHAAHMAGLWATAREAGINRDGYCLDTVEFALKPGKSSIRLWPHAEGLKAALSMARRDAEAEKFALTMLEALNGLFLSGPFAGGWIDRFDAHGSPLVDFVPASSLYHIYLAATELEHYRNDHWHSLLDASDHVVNP